MNCCGTTETKKDDKLEQEKHPHAEVVPSGHAHTGCGMHSGWMQWLWIGLLIFLAASYFMK